MYEKKNLRADIAQKVSGGKGKGLKMLISMPVDSFDYHYLSIALSFL